MMRYSLPILWLKYINREPRIGGMVFGCLAGGMLLIVTYFALSALPTVWSLLIHGESVQAKVVGKNQSTGPTTRPPVAAISTIALGGRKASYFVRYEFTTANGNSFNGSGRIPFTSWNTLRTGDEISVRYASNDPAINQPVSGMWEYAILFLFGLLGPTIFSFSLWHGLRGLWWTSTQVFLIRFGTPMLGRLRQAESKARTGRRQSGTVTLLEYEVPNVPEMTGKLELEGKMPNDWKPADHVLIFVSGQQPKRQALDLFDARRADRLKMIAETKQE